MYVYAACLFYACCSDCVVVCCVVGIVEINVQQHLIGSQAITG